MIAEGTALLLVGSQGRRHVVRAAKGMLEVSGLGVIDGDALCAASFGDMIRIGGQEFTVLKPSVRDLLNLIERKAQVMMPKDSFLIPLHLDIGSGSKVIEGGVGSGALTIVLLRTVAPTGRVFSYEIRDDYAKLAKKNIAMADLSSCWDLKVADVCSTQLEKDVDAAVVDIPNPWDAVENVSASLRVGGHLCCYVPNVNQLDTTVRKMREIGFGEVVAFETLQREMIVHEGGIRPSFDMLGHTGYLAFARKMKH